MDSTTETLLATLLSRLERLLPPQVPQVLVPGCYRWQHSTMGFGYLSQLHAWRPPSLRQLYGLDDEIKQLRGNTEAFWQGKPANHAVLTGPRGCGKTTMVHGIAGEFAQKGMVVVRMGRELFHELPQLATATANLKHKLLVICDELSFSVESDGHLAAKAAIDDLEANESHILIYVTSNRRRLMPERLEENMAATNSPSGEVNPAESTEEKVSLSDRFGLWIPVFQPDEGQFHEMVQSQLKNMGARKAAAKELSDATRWAEERGSMNGRIAVQYARHLVTERK